MGIGEWQGYLFRPAPGACSTDAIRDFLARLRRALRAAHGLSIPLQLSWTSGGAGGVELRVPRPVGIRWVQFGFSSAYEFGQWRATRPFHSEQTRGTTLFAATLGGRAELPLPSGPEEVPWCDTVLGELNTIRPGVTVDWELQPDPAVPTRGKWDWIPTRPTADEARNLTSTERVLNDRQVARSMGLHWRVYGKIRAERHPENREAAGRVARLIEKASHLDGGNRIAYRPIRLSHRVRGPYTALCEAELVGLFPPPTAASRPRSRDDDSSEARLWIGRDLSGFPLGLPFDAGQGRHLLVLGETGMGKSSLLVRLAGQAARRGSVILFDPIGDTAREFLSSLPESRIRDVSWVSPALPVLNLSLLAEIASGGARDMAHRERLLGDVLSALRRVRAGRYVDSTYWGPRLEEMLLQALRAASHWNGATLGVAEQLLTPEGFSFRAVPEDARAPVAEVRRRIERAPQDGDGARRLLSEITRSEVLRQMLDASSPTWSVDAAVAPSRLTVISGDAPQVGESVSRYLLAIVLALAWNAVLRRARASKIFLILDEAQWYVHDGVAEMLRLGRRFNLHVWAVTQSLRSLPEDVRDALTTNSADLVLFRGEPSDAREVARWAPGVSPERLLRLARGEAAVLVDKGAGVHWARLFPPPGGSRDPLSAQPTQRANAEVESPNAARWPENSPFQSGDPRFRPNGVGVTDPLFEALNDVLSRADVPPEFVLHLSELRSRWRDDPRLADQRVRSGGRLLSSWGVLVRTGRDDGGSFWVLSRDRLVRCLSAAPQATHGQGEAS